MQQSVCKASRGTGNRRVLTDRRLVMDKKEKEKEKE
jgi:hypothetical protein